MNLGWALMMVFVVAAGVVGVYYVSSQKVTTPATDTYGMYAGNQTNTSYQLATNSTAPMGTMGAGIAAIAGILVVIGVVSVVVYSASSGSGYSRTRYR